MAKKAVKKEEGKKKKPDTSLTLEQKITLYTNEVFASLPLKFNKLLEVPEVIAFATTVVMKSAQDLAPYAKGETEREKLKTVIELISQRAIASLPKEEEETKDSDEE